MGLYGICGVPGSGKTYWAVHHLVTKYYDWNKLHGEFIKRFQVEIVTNIDELKLDHFSLDEMIARAGGVEKFFNVEYQRKNILSKMGRVVYIVDEAGKYFPKGFKDEAVLYFFQYHRHLGIDIYLISSGFEGLSPGLLRLLEFRLQAKERSRRVFSEMRYVKFLGADRAGNSILKKDSRIFALYRSMDVVEIERVPSVTRKYVLMTVIILICGALLVRYVMSKWSKNSIVDNAHASEKAALAPPLNSKSSVVSKGKVGPSVLAEQGVKTEAVQIKKVGVAVGGGGITSEKRVEWPTYETLARDFVRVRFYKDGERVVVYTDERLVPQDEWPLLLRDSLNIGGALWVKRTKKSGTREPVERVPPMEGASVPQVETGLSRSGSVGGVAVEGRKPVVVGRIR